MKGMNCTGITNANHTVWTLDRTILWLMGGRRSLCSAAAMNLDQPGKEHPKAVTKWILVQDFRTTIVCPSLMEFTYHCADKKANHAVVFQQHRDCSIYILNFFQHTSYTFQSVVSTRETHLFHSRSTNGVLGCWGLVAPFSVSGLGQHQINAAIHPHILRESLLHERPKIIPDELGEQPAFAPWSSTSLLLGLHSRP